MNKYLITGANGHVGLCLVDKLANSKEKVRVLLLPNESLPYKNIEIIHGDVRDKDSIRPLFENNGSDELIVIHLAGVISIKSKLEQTTYDVNVTGTKNVIDLAREYKVKKVIYVSSVHALEEKSKKEVIKEQYSFNPKKVVGQYAKTKAEATQYALDVTRTSGLDISIVHPSGIIGPFDKGRSHLVALLKDYYTGKLSSIVHGGYDFVDVRDVVDGILKASVLGRKGECYILSGHYYTIKELLRIASKVTGKKEMKSIIPTWLAKFFAPLEELWYRIRRVPPLYTSYSIYTLNSNSNFSNQKAKDELDYKVRDIKDTIKDTYDYLVDNNVCEKR